MEGALSRERNETRDPEATRRTFSVHRFRREATRSRVSLRSPGTREGGARTTRATSRRAQRTVGRGRIHDVKQRSVLRSRGALLRPGLVLLIASIPEEGWAERRQAHLSCCRVCETRRSARVRRGASHDAGRSPLGAPPWRFSAGGRASISGIASGSVQRCSSQPGRRAWRAVSRTSRARGYEPRPQDATPRSAYRTVSGRRPSMSEDGKSCTINSLRSQYKSSIRSQNDKNGPKPPPALHHFTGLCWIWPCTERTVMCHKRNLGWRRAQRPPPDTPVTVIWPPSPDSSPCRGSLSVGGSCPDVLERLLPFGTARLAAPAPAHDAPGGAVRLQPARRGA